LGILVQSIDGIGDSQWRSVDKRGQDLVRLGGANLNLCVPPVWIWSASTPKFWTGFALS
jgi:hypothetical protein